LNNLGVISSNNGNNDAAASLFQQAHNADSGWEAHWNSGNGIKLVGIFERRAYIYA